MATHQLAKGLASLGRHGDSMLMHVSPSEVAGLKAVGAMTGHKLSTNPYTGMPEAFDFGDFFTSLLPTAAGFLMGGPAGAALGLKGTAATLAPIAAGVATGAAVAGAKGEDVLTGSLMGGLGGFGGGNLAGSLGKMGAQGGYQAGQEVAKGTAITNAAGQEALNTAANPFFGTAETMPTALTNVGSSAASGASAAAPMAYSEGLGQMGRGAMDLLSPGGYDKFTSPAIGGSAMQLGAPLGMAALSGAQEDLYPKPDESLEEKRKAEENKYRDPRTGLLNLAQASPGLKLMATGGTVGTTTSTISSGGIQDLYGTNDQTTGAQQLSRDGYGIGRLDSLASEGSRAKAADTFYAMGGPVSFADGGTTAGSAIPLAIPESQLRYMRGPSRIYRGATSGPSYSSGTGGNLMTDYYNTWQRSFPGFAAPSLNNPRSYFGGPGSRVGGIRFLEGGIASFAKGGHQGYLDGEGDGMSDSIPATIEGKQPARLADGEFVIPADVVSHLGNGSSKAGSKQLYSMLDRIRKARTGHTKQGKEIKPQKYMPA